MAIQNYFEQALRDEGILGTPLEPIARSVFQQESSSGRNPTTSNAGAVGGMQMLPTTFQGVADSGWSITDPYHNARGGIRYLKEGWQKSGNDPHLTAAYYYGGPGGMNKLSRGIAVSDPRNPNAPTTRQYADQVVNRANGLNISGNNMQVPVLQSLAPNEQVVDMPMNDTANRIPMLAALGGGPNQPKGILQAISDAPGAADALLGMASGLLSSPNPREALSKGFAGFQTGYQTGMTQQGSRVTPLANGAALAITKKDGTVEVVPIPEVQKFLKDKGDADLARQLSIMGFKFDNQPLTPGEQRELRELDQTLMQTQSKLESVKSLKQQLNDPKINQALRQAIGADPTGITRKIGAIAGWDEYTLSKKLEGLQVDQWLAQSAFLKGAISDAENKRLQAPIPDTFASVDALNTWIEQRIKDLEVLQSGTQRIRDTDYRKNPNSTRPSAAPAAPSAAPAPAAAPEPAPAAPAVNNDNPLNLNLPSLKR